MYPRYGQDVLSGSFECSLVHMDTETFFVQSPPLARGYEQMQRGLNRVYLRDGGGTLMNPDTYVIGRCCIYKGRTRVLRCEIMEIDDDDFVSVYFIDIGSLKYVYGPNTLYEPRVLCRMMPAFAIECRLYGVSARDLRRARNLFEQICCGVVTAIVVDYDAESSVIVVRLIEQNGIEVRDSIDEELRNNPGHANATLEPVPDDPPSDVDLDAEREE